MDNNNSNKNFDPVTIVPLVCTVGVMILNIVSACAGNKIQDKVINEKVAEAMSKCKN